MRFTEAGLAKLTAARADGEVRVITEIEALVGDVSAGEIAEEGGYVIRNQAVTSFNNGTGVFDPVTL